MAQKHDEPKQDVNGFNAITAQWGKSPGILLEGSPSHSSSQFISVHNMIKFLRAGQPKEGTAERKIYDQAVKVIGEGDADHAVYALQLLHVDLLKELSTKITCRSDVGNEKVANELENTLLEISRGVSNRDSEYLTYSSPRVLSSSAQLTRNLSRQTPFATAGTVGVTTVASAGSEDYLRIPTADKNRSVVVRTAGSSQGFSPVVIPPNQLVSSFGGVEQDAGNFADAVVTGLRAYATKGDEAAAISALKSSIAPLQNNPNVANNPNFQAAKQALKDGDLRTALLELSKVGALGSLFQNLDRFTVVTVDNRAINWIDVNLVFTIKFDSDAEFEKAKAAIDPTSAQFFGFTRLDLGARYKYNQYQGRQETYRVDYGGTLDPKLEVTRDDSATRQLSGEGHDILGVVEAYLSGTSPGFLGSGPFPYNIILYAQPGFRTWKLESAEVDVRDREGNLVKQKVDLGHSAFILGPTGIEFNLPGQRERQLFRLSGIGAEFTGSTDSKNFVDQVSIYAKGEGTYYESSAFAIVGNARFDASLGIDSTIDGNVTVPLSIRGEPVNFVFRTGDHVIMFGPTGEVVAEITQSEAQRTLVHWGVGGALTWAYKDWLQLTASGGYAHVDGIAPHGTPHAGLSARFLFPGSSSAVPTKLAESKAIGEIYATAETFSRQPVTLINSAAGEAIAVQTAVLLEQNIRDSSEADRIIADPEYVAAIAALKAGQFSVGFTHLRGLAKNFPDVFTPKRGD
ncbi:MAG: hypothetical protein ABID61_01335 [Candidatus Micrarchaeota archaeon]